MYRNVGSFALVDTMKLINAYAEMTQTYINEGFEPYLTSFMFNIKRLGSRDPHSQVIDEVTRVYSNFITRVVRDPKQVRDSEYRPVLIGVPDYPVFKWTNGTKKRMQANNEGVHLHGILLIPPFNRLKVGVKDHFKIKRKSYIGPDFPLSRIDVQHIESDIPFTVDYVFKSLKRNWCGRDDILVLPKSRKEVSPARKMRSAD